MTTDVKGLEVPNILYRYRPVNKYTIKGLIAGEQYFSSIINFNDPFEFKYQIKNLNLSLKKAKSLADKLFPLKTKEEKRNFYYDIFNNKKRFKSFLFNIIDDRLKKAGVCCFSELDDSILMWSHYTNNHEGVVFGYDNRDLYKESISGYKCIYNLELLNIDVVSDLLEDKIFIDDILRTKNKGWSYEKEIRMISLNEGLYSFNKNCLTEAIFGVKTKQEDQEQVIKIIKKNGYKNVNFFKMKMSTTEYKLNKLPILY